MEVGSERGILICHVGSKTDVTDQQVQFLTKLPHAPAERIKQRSMTKLAHARAEVTEPGGLLLQGSSVVTPFRRSPSQQTLGAFVERRRFRSFFMRKVIAVAKKD